MLLRLAGHIVLSMSPNGLVFLRWARGPCIRSVMNLQNGTPRRTVAAVAAAVAGTALFAAARPTQPATRAREPPLDTLSDAEGNAGDPAQLLASLRAVRKAQRSRRKQRRREAKQAAQNAQRPAPSETQLGADVSHAAGTAGQSAELGGSSCSSARSSA